MERTDHSLTEREVLFRESEFVPIYPLPGADEGEKGAHHDMDEDEMGDEDIMDVEFVVRGDLDGDGNQELIFASIDGCLVIIKSRGVNQFHFQYPGTLPLDDLVCGIDIGPIYHHHSYTEKDNVKSTANGVYVLTLGGTLLILSVEELKFLPSSPHYDYKCYDTSNIDSGITREIQKSIFTGVAVLKVLLEIRPNGIVSPPTQPSIEIPPNCTCFRVLDDRTCESGGLTNPNACSVLLAMGGRDHVYLFTHDLLSMSVRNICDGIPVDTEVHSLDIFSHKHYSSATTSCVTNFVVAGTKSGAVLCWKVPLLKETEGTSASTIASNKEKVEAGGASVVTVRLGSAPPPAETGRQPGPAYIRMLPASDTLGAHEGELCNQDPFFVAAWLDGRVGICRITEREDGRRDGQGEARWEWTTMQCLHTSQTLYKADYFDQPLFYASDGIEGKGKGKPHTVSCAVTSWTGCTYLFTIRLPVQRATATATATAAAAAAAASPADEPADQSDVKETEMKTNSGEGEGEGEGEERDSDDADTEEEEEVARGENEDVIGKSMRVMAAAADSDIVANDSLEISEHSGGSGADLFKERLSGDDLPSSAAAAVVDGSPRSSSPWVEGTSSSSSAGAEEAGAGIESEEGEVCDSDDGALATEEDEEGDGDGENQVPTAHDGVLYSFDSRVLTGASASRDFCCARQGDSQALVYISVSGMCTAIPNVSEQIRGWGKAGLGASR